MAKLSSTETYQFTDVEGASYTLRVVTEELRLAIRSQILDDLNAYNLLIEEYVAIDSMPREEKDGKRKQAVDDLAAGHRSKMDRAWMDCVLKSINDLEVDDTVVTLDNFTAQAPGALYAEVVAKVRERTGLLGAPAKN